MNGPLAGCKVVELAGIGPGPYAAMVLADLGADVVRIDRPGGSGFFAGDEELDILNRGKQSILLNLKTPEGVSTLLNLVARADVLIEGYRPGVAERLGVGPTECLGRNPQLVYGRMTGWGQGGPIAQTAGHDINYLALTGALHAIGRAGGPPQIPLNLLGDFGGGAMFLVIGVLAALREADRSGGGQIVDAAIVDGVSHLLSSTHMMMAAGAWTDARGQNVTDGGAPYYSVYETSDGHYMAVGAIESKFYSTLLSKLDIDEPVEAQDDRERWPALRKKLELAFSARTRDEWSEVFYGSDACVAPVRTLRDAADHPQLGSRGTLVDRGGVLQAAPAPRFSGWETVVNWPPPRPGEHSAAILHRWGISGTDDHIGAEAPTGSVSLSDKRPH